MPTHVYVDFDGTVTRQDTLVYLLDRYVGDGWLEIEGRVEDGSLSEEQGLRDEIALIRAPWAEARDAVLADVPVDPHFGAFVDFCARRGWPLAILSGGLAPLIRAVLAREGLAELALHSNDLAFEEDGRWRVLPATSPRINRLCNHCKSHWLVAAQAAGARVVYVGDGTTDRCPAGHADLVFAKAGLRRWCDERGIDHLPYESFRDVLAWMASEAGRRWIDQSV